MRPAIKCVLLLTVALVGVCRPGDALMTRIKDIACISGLTEHKLMGYGLVVGLEGSGDSSRAAFTVQSLANMLERFGVSVNPEQLRVKNVAAVMVVADLPAVASRGARLDVLLSSLGDAQSLHGGTLLATPLRGADAEVYALAQGPVTIGGFNFGAGGDKIQKNHPVVGRVPGGATVTTPMESSALDGHQLCLLLHNPDYTTARRVAEAIERAFGPMRARALNDTMVQVQVPSDCADLVAYITGIEQLEVEPDAPARVVINERTGTVVIGEHVRIAPVAISHGSLTIQVRAELQVSQPNPFAGGETAVVPNEEIEVTESGEAGLMMIPAQASLDDLITALNSLGVGPRDLIAIIQALQAAHALEAEVTIQ
jgi:flagellar P-ring protein precursor FlgI